MANLVTAHPQAANAQSPVAASNAPKKSTSSKSSSADAAAEGSAEFSTQLHQQINASEAKKVEKTDAKTGAKKDDKKAEAQEMVDAALTTQALAMASLKQQVPTIAAKTVTQEDAKADATAKLVADKAGNEKATAKAGEKSATAANAALNAKLEILPQNQLQAPAAANGKADVAATLAAAQAAQANVQNQTVEGKVVQLKNQAQAKIQNQGQEPNHALQAQEMAGIASLQNQYQFEVDAGVGEKPAAGVGAKEATAKGPTKFNTNDFLNLREMSQNQVKQVTAKDSISAQNPFPSFSQTAQTNSPFQQGLNSLKGDSKKVKIDATAGAASAAIAGAQHQTSNIDARHFAKTIDAPVTTGSQQKPVLSHDAIHQITSQVSLMNMAKQDGEIKIRLRPDHLGELQMSVRTQGQAVSIQIKAENNESKKIIEESLSSLKDSLGQQNLTLSQIDVVVPTTSSSNSQDMNMQFDSSARQNHDSGFQGNSEQNSRQERLYEADAIPGNLNRAGEMSFRRARPSTSQNLDLIA